jgi:16S rRNA processing protein RimM
LKSLSEQAWSEEGWVTVAVLIKPRGIRGELTAHSLTSGIERLQQLKTVHLFGVGKAYEVEQVWDHGGTPVFKFHGVDSMNDAELLRGAEVRIPASERMEPEPGEFFHSDLIGCEMRDAATGRLIGKVTGWEEYGGPALLEVDDGRVLVPFVKAICVDIRPADGVVRVNLPEGLETLDAPL